jgi:trimethylamine--corrinoid protein Co-methyltransferase
MSTLNRATLVVWDEDACRRVHEASLTLLEECGVEVRNYPAALELFAAAGARVDGDRVRIPAEVVEAALSRAPRTWPVRWRTPGAGDGLAAGGSRGAPDGVLSLSNGPSYFGPGSDCIYVRDPDTHERRRATVADVEAMARVSEQLPNLDFVMSMGLPGDVPLVVDDLEAVAAMMRATRKPLLVAPKDGLAVPVIKDMAQACGAADSVMIYSMPSPPLMHDGDALGKVIACAELEVPLIYASSPACGTTAPRSVTAAVMLDNAEVLSGLVLHQHVRPGAPFVYGVGIAAIDMRVGYDPHSAPEQWLGQLLGTDLARYYDLPSFNYAGMTDANDLDEQWTAEEFASCILGALQRSTLVHDVGYMEVGLQSSYESLVFGDECLGWARAFMQEVSVDDVALALDEIIAQGPGGHHLATKYTRTHNRDFWVPRLFDRIMHDKWEKDGKVTLKQRVSARVQELRATPAAWELDPETQATLAGLVGEARRLRDEAAS